EVWIVGVGRLRAELEHDAPANVRFLGKQPHSHIVALLAECRALVLCSLQEGVPNVVLEALAAGRPVVSTPVRPGPDLVRAGVQGRLVPIGDAERLAQALLELQDLEQWRAWSSAARTAALRFDWSELVTRVEGGLRAVLSGDAT